jgi:hypothetical protein
MVGEAGVVKALEDAHHQTFGRRNFYSIFSDSNSQLLSLDNGLLILENCCIPNKEPAFPIEPTCYIKLSFILQFWFKIRWSLEFREIQAV